MFSIASNNLFSLQPNADALELAVEELRKKYLESRQRSRPGQGTPPAVTTVDRSNGSHNAWGGFISRTIPATTTVGGLSAPAGNTNASNTNDTVTKVAPGKRSHSRSRSRSRSRSPNDDSRSRQRKKSRHRSPQASNKYGGSGSGGGGNNNKKKSSRNYSRSPSSSPHGGKHSRKRFAIRIENS